MQIFGLNEEGEAIEAAFAYKQIDYTCIECGSPLRVRRGAYQIPHFYHYQSEKPCSQKKKGLVHLKIQLDLQNRMGAKMEVPFPQIKRIADIVWDAHKIVFEIQISPISPEEVAKRIFDYQSQGYQVVWLLYDKTFNQDRVSLAENYLKNQHTHYYTNGSIYYDQLSLVRKNCRLNRLMKKKINIESPHVPKFPRFNREWKLSFEGDLLSVEHLNPLEMDEYLEFIKERRTKYSFLVHLYNYFLLKASN